MSINPNRISFMDATNLAREVYSMVESVCSKVMIVGSLRRMKADIGDIDILTLPKTPVDLDNAILKIPGVKIISGIGGAWQVIFEYKGIKFNLLKATPSSWGAALLHSTGSAQFNIDMRFQAKQRGFKLALNGATPGSLANFQSNLGRKQKMESLALAVILIVASYGFIGSFIGFIVGDLTKSLPITVVCALTPGLLAGYFTSNPFWLILWMFAYGLGYVLGNIFNKG